MNAMNRARSERALAGIPIGNSDDEDREYVWAVIGNGRKRRVLREVAEAEGWEIDTSKPKKFEVQRPNTYRLPKEERFKVSMQLGIPVEDYANLKRIYREKDFRDLEPGEPAYEKKKIIAEWARAGSPGECPVGRHGLQGARTPRRTQLDEYIERRKAGY